MYLTLSIGIGGALLRLIGTGLEEKALAAAAGYRIAPRTYKDEAGGHQTCH